MHEVSLAGGILSIVEEAAQREAFTQVTALRLEVGALAGVDVRALRFALEAIAPQTLLEGAQIMLDEAAGTAWCMKCSSTQTITQLGQDCPSCGSAQLQATGGKELRVVDMSVR